jgi:RsmE family RNA methyltransferase
VLFEESECSINAAGNLTANLRIDDARSKHIATILQLTPGNILKVGVLDRGNTDIAILDETSSESLSFNIGHPSSIVLNARPVVDLILAVPRPLRLERLIPIITSMGVGRIILVGAAKVEKDYFGSHLFRRPEALRACIVEGLSQAGVDCRVPEIIVRKSLAKFLSREVEDMFDSRECLRVICHPLKSPEGGQGMRMSQLTPDESVSTRRVVLAIGPEGGWTDEEVALFESLHFRNIDLGRRILRTDTAVSRLIGTVCTSDIAAGNKHLSRLSPH